jgi:hypothetical protein
MMGNTITVNLLAPLLIAFSLWLGATGRVDWWVIILVAVSPLAMNAEFRVRR